MNLTNSIQFNLTYIFQFLVCTYGIINSVVFVVIYAYLLGICAVILTAGLTYIYYI